MPTLRRLLVLLAIVLVPQWVQAQENSVTSEGTVVLTVAGVEFTDTQLAALEGSTTVTGTYITSKSGSVTLTPAVGTNPVTLTLTEASFNEIIDSKIDLAVHLVGRSSYEGGYTTAASPVFKGDGSHTLTFTSDATSPGSIYAGSTSSINYFMNGWSSSSTQIFHTASEGNAYDFDWWADQGCDYMTIWPNEKYDLQINGSRFSDAWWVQYEPNDEYAAVFMYDDKTLVVNDSKDYAIVSNMADLTVAVLGTTAMSSIRFAATDQVSAGTLTIAKYEFSESELNSLTLHNTKDNDPTIYGFSEVTISEPLILNTPSQTPDWATYTGDVVISDYYGLTVAGTAVTSANAANVMGDQETATVSFDATSNTLTLNNATLTIPSGTNAVESSLENLTVNLVGGNIITCQGNSDLAFKGTGSNTVTFTASSTGGNLQVQVSDEAYLFSGITPSYSNGLVLTSSGYTHTIDVVSYGLTVGGTAVTSANATNVMGNEGTATVSYDATTNTLTLNNANIQPKEEAPGIDYTGETAFVISLIGNSTVQGIGGCEAIRYDGYSETGPMLSFARGDDHACSLQLISGDNVISGFTADYTGFNAITQSTGNMLITTSEYYNIIVAGVAVTESNYTDVHGDGTVSFDNSTKTLTLNGANLNGGISYSSEDALTVHLKGENVIDGGWSEYFEGEHAFSSSTENVRLLFTTDDETPGQLLMKNTYRGTNVQYYSGFTDSYANGLTAGYSTADKRLIATGPVLTPGEGLYWPDQTYTITSNHSGTITYTDMKGQFSKTEYTAPFTIETTGNYLLSVSQSVTYDESKFTLSSPTAVCLVYTKPGFGLAAGTYTGTQTITLTNLPSDLADAATGYPQVWYYKGDNATDSVLVTTAEQTIEVSESTKVCVYIIDEDSGKVVKSDTVQASYVIKHDADIAFMQNSKPVEVCENTIGGDDPAYPVLENNSQLPVTYSSDDETVASIDATSGDITLHGIGETTISASWSATETLNEGTASYVLRVFKDLSHSDITVTVADVIYTGEALTPAVTVVDGETDITQYVTAAYAHNIDVGNAQVTITPNGQMEPTNYYVGSQTATFSISYRTLVLGKDVTFATGQTWASFYTTTESLDLPDGVMAYIVTKVGDNSVTVSPIRYIPQEVPVLLENNTSVTDVTNKSADGNLLYGTYEAFDVSYADGPVYALYADAMMRVASGTIPAGKCYLMLEAMQTPQTSPRLTIDNGDAATTGIEIVRSSRKDADEWYTLNGQKLQGKPSQKGVYVKNGVKVVLNK